MNLLAWVDPRVRRVTIHQLRAYLTSHGWHEKEYPRPELLVFEGPLDDAGEPIALSFPASERYRDFHDRVISVIGALGIIENRYAVEILNEMLAGDEANGRAPHDAATTAEVTGT